MVIENFDMKWFHLKVADSSNDNVWLILQTFGNIK